MDYLLSRFSISLREPEPQKMCLFQRSKEKERNKFRLVQGNKQEGIIFEHATNKSITERRLWIRVACKIYRRDSVMVLRLGNDKGYIAGTEKRKKN